MDTINFEEYKYWYINRDADGLYVGLNEELDPESNYLGGTLDDYDNGAWVLLDTDQIAFKQANPEASLEEVFNMELGQVDEPGVSGMDVDELGIAKQAKLRAIEWKDNESNKFFISFTKGGAEVANIALWLDKDLRNSLYSITLPALLADGETTTKLWADTTPPQSVEVPISWAMDKLPLLEIYAKRTYDIRSSNEAAAYAAETVEAVQAIDPSSGYPNYLTFELNLDMQ